MFSGSRLSLVVLGALCVGLFAAGCGSSEYEELRSRVRWVPDRWIRALVAEDPSQFEAMVDGIGASHLVYLASEVNAAISSASLEQFVSSSAVVDRPLNRVLGALRSRYGFEKYWDLRQRFRALPPEDAFAARRMWTEAHSVERDASLTDAQKADLARTYASRIDSTGWPLPTALIWLHAAERYARADNTEAAVSSVRSAIERGLEQGDHVVTCQALGLLGVHLHQANRFESMRLHWEQALEIAMQHQLGAQTGRIISFFAGHARSEGRLDLARRLLHEAEEQNRAFGGSPSDARFIIKYLEFNADLDCWNVVEQGLPRIPRALDQMREWVSNQRHFEEYSAHAEVLRGRSHAARGDQGRADREFASALDRFSAIEHEQYANGVRRTWARSLLEDRRPAKAVDLLQPCLDSTDSLRTLVEAHVLLAEAHAQLGQWDRCEARLDDVAGLEVDNSPAYFREFIRVRELSARLHFARGRREEAIATIKETCDLIEQGLVDREASQESFLLLRDLEPFHQLLHELVETDTELTLELELAWRGVPGLLGQGQGYDRAGSPLQACKEIIGRTNAVDAPAGKLTLVDESRLPAEGMIELIYLVEADSLVRWTRVGTQLASSAVAIDADDLRQRVGMVLEKLERAVDEDARLDAGLREGLRELARLLLPEPMFSGDGSGAGAIRHLRILPGTHLSGFPFGALNLSETGYEPLLRRFDPVYERGHGHSAPAGTARGPGLIIADPAVSPSLAAWESGLPRLEHGIREARALHDWEPGSILLEREAATKAAIRRHWERARFIYFASHVVQDPSSPYLSWIPLAKQDVVQGQAVVQVNEYLNIQDIRSARLHAAPLVVLSACSSGAPYQTRRALAPSLGDAFIDAGASTVIQNLWSVRDDAAAELMQRTMRAWSLDDTDPDCALNDARREMASSGRFTHPYFWGAAVVQVRGR